MPAKVQHPFDVQTPGLLYHLTGPAAIGCLSGASLAALPSQYIPTIADPAALQLPEGVDSDVAHRLALAFAGFVFGYAAQQGLNWLRLKALKKLFTYHGWVTQPKSTKTKVWGMLTSLLRGRGPFKTFEFQRLLPNQPLPELNNTLDRWLKIAKRLLSEEDFDATKEAVEEFRVNEGPKLHAFLQQKAKKEDSWIADYWLNIAYLSPRTPLPVYSNYFMTYAHELGDFSQVTRAANITHLTAKFEAMLSSEQLSPVFIQNLVPLCMHGFSYLFNSTRIPGDYIDELVRYPGHNHILVLRKGYFYKLEVSFTDEQGQKCIYTPYELKRQFERIIEMADNEVAKNGRSPAFAALTAQERNVWAKHRRELEKWNSESLKEIDTAMFVLCLEDDSPKDNDDFFKRMLTGNGYNRWFDKCFNVAVFANGWAATNFEHSALDGMISCVLLEYTTLFDVYDENKDVPQTSVRPMKTPVHLVLTDNGMSDGIAQALQFNEELNKNIQVHTIAAPYGKRYMKQQRISPDGYIQMSMQLAFYRMHKHLPKTYEPSTGRMFLLGRTETVHPRSDASNEWVKMMDDVSVDKQTKIDTLRKAVKLQTEDRLTATIGEGCDRHLVAMLCASRELGMDMPKVFTEKAFRLPFQLSTSQASNMFREYGCKLNYDHCFGGFGPTDMDGYGVGYCVFGEDIINMQLTCWDSCEKTDVHIFGEHIKSAFEDIKALFSS